MLRALVLLLRYSGLRIRDAVTLSKSRLSGNRLFLYTAKTGTSVFVPLPEFVVDGPGHVPWHQRRLLLLDWRFKAEGCRRGLAASLEEVVQAGRRSRWSRAPIPGYLRRGTVALRCPVGACLGPVGPSKREGHRTPLRALGEGQTGAIGVRR